MRKGFYLLIAVLTLCLAACGDGEPSGQTDASSTPSQPEQPFPGNSFETGTVTVLSGGQTYEPYLQGLFTMRMTNSGLTAGDGPLLRFSEVFDSLPEIVYTDDFQVIIDGKDARKTAYSWRTEITESLYPHGSEWGSTFSVPDEAGVYLLCVDVYWSGSDPNGKDYTALRYIFKVAVSALPSG